MGGATGRATQCSLENIAKEHVIINFDHEFSKHSYFIMYFPKKPFKAFLLAVIPFIPSIPENLAVRNRIPREKTEFSGMNGMNGIIQMRKIPEPIFRIFEQPWGDWNLKRTAGQLVVGKGTHAPEVFSPP